MKHSEVEQSREIEKKRGEEKEKEVYDERGEQETREMQFFSFKSENI